MAENEYHVSSFVVQSVTGLEVHAEEEGKLIVTAEAANVRELAELSAVLQETDKVMSVAPIYHEFSSEGE